MSKFLKLLKIDEEKAKKNKDIDPLALKIILVIAFMVVFCLLFYVYSANINSSTSYNTETIYESANITDENFLNTVKTGNFNEVKRHISLGANIKAVDPTGRNAIMLASSFNFDSSLIDLLSSSGADINHQDYNGYDALMLSILTRSYTQETIDKLINLGIDVNNLTNSKISTLMVALGTINDTNAIEKLLKAGADINYTNDYGVTPIMVAAKITTNPEIIELLLRYGANTNVVDDLGINVYEIAMSNDFINTNQELMNKLK